MLTVHAVHDRMNARLEKCTASKHAEKQCTSTADLSCNSRENFSRANSIKPSTSSLERLKFSILNA